ncbi:TCP-1/cpn60 chaperonin family protein [Tengunoibacter tsumagoiensis]|uniref:60 kDa chaperonin n=1 Tax=Tengunoibacter tsumagoiensis TaxID=2014871 RepID=A0A402A3Y0_9CHLR|nr:TCP-1/cpn60 chaperonin family protein [Tengunoibacter tsumagoiensis]GCE13782.1 60 kDa chaperonin [Tengunoibacter tsumagoiensis]
MTVHQELLQSPASSQILKRGFETLATPIATTLGPSQRVVINAVTPSEIELLADTGTIARRFLELPNRGENIGAMLLRTMILQMHETYGDGAATATVLARAMLREGTRMTAAGMHSTLLKRGIERGVAIAQQQLDQQVQPVSGQEMLTKLSIALTGNEELGQIIGEMADVLGENAPIVIHDSEASHHDREYVSGGSWPGYPGERLLIPEGKAGLELQHPLILLINENVEELSQVQAALEFAVSLPEKPPLLLIARSIKGPARDALILNHTRGVLTIGIGILSSGIMTSIEDMGDMAALTGARVLSEETGYSPKRFMPSYLGQARKATITHSNITIIDGSGEQQQIRTRMSEIKARIKQSLKEKKDSQEEREFLRARLGRLAGGVGVLKLSSASDKESEDQKERVRNALRVIEDVREHGVVAGGGVAYLSCIKAIEQAALACSQPDEAAGIALVAKALSAPFLQIVQNFGRVYPPLALDEVQRLGAGYGFDARTGQYVSMLEAGIFDSAYVVRAALEAASSVATMALTTEALILM